MSILDQIRSIISQGDPSANAPGALIEHAASMIGGAGGVSALLQKFRDAGHGNLVDSWVSKGSSLPVSAGQIQNVLGADAIQSAAQKLGLSPEQASSGLATLLPHMIDKLTPNGTVPEHGMLEQALGAIKSKLMN